MPRQRRVLLGQLSAAGDCVYATTVARQIKADDPDCHLTWAIGSPYRQIIEHNPHVDEVWEVEHDRREQMAAIWVKFEREALERKARGDFDDVYFTQIYPNNLRNFDATVRASIFRGYPRPITVPVTPVIRLDQLDRDRVAEFVAAHHLDKSAPTILFECTPGSGQSTMTPAWAIEMIKNVSNAMPSVRFVMASPIDSGLLGPGIIDGSRLSFRQIAALAGHCSLFVGCSSGLTWLLTSDAAEKIPMIQALTGVVGPYGAVVHDLDHWKLPSDHVIELFDTSPAYAATCAVAVLTEGIRPARQRYHEELVLGFQHYHQTMLLRLRQGHALDFATSVGHTIARYGFKRELLAHLGPALWNVFIPRRVRNLFRP